MNSTTLFRLCLLVLMCQLSACVAVVNTDKEKVSKSQDIQFHASDFYRKNDYPFSQFVEADGWVFLSGALGLVPGGGLASGGMASEAHQTMKNIQSTLQSAGLNMSHVVKCTVMLADMTEWATFNQVYKQYFDENYPARSAFGTNGLALDARVEVECIARR